MYASCESAMRLTDSHCSDICIVLCLGTISTILVKEEMSSLTLYRTSTRLYHTSTRSTRLDTAANMWLLGTGINLGVADMILPAHAQDISLEPHVESLQAREVELCSSPTSQRHTAGLAAPVM